ncbi:GNAT family N-acetyltransferase [Falsibacillus albus]|uniref:GNAT family N-acetyltransferase n=1 Tax=Falsibacillus albus TaxID=2478915 RepID=A0A3L7K3E2_9BACI|nr:GNAT family N-acetyltransferase [Falsibacillus albus]RLQ97155.1 GNAT family N-acetyltransferase [Falsibacillus albus]
MIAKIVNGDQELMQAFSVRRKVFIDEQKVPAEEEIDQFEQSCTHFLLLEDDNPIGAGRFRIIDGKGKVERICVLNQFRGNGAGKLIMDKIEEYAKDGSVEYLKLNAQTHAIPFYERLGYEVISEEFLDAGIPHKSMQKQISII